MFIECDRKSVFSYCPYYKRPVRQWASLLNCVCFSSMFCFTFHLSDFFFSLHIQSSGLQNRVCIQFYLNRPCILLLRIVVFEEQTIICDIIIRQQNDINYNVLSFLFGKIKKDSHSDLISFGIPPYKKQCFPLRCAEVLQLLLITA